MEAQSTFHLPLTDVICQDGINANEDEVICGLVLAGGEGKRLQPFIKSLGKGTLPKQYVNFIGSHSMLEHTIRRAEKIIPPERSPHRYHGVPFAVSRGQATMFR